MLTKDRADCGSSLSEGGAGEVDDAKGCALGDAVGSGNAYGDRESDDSTDHAHESRPAEEGDLFERLNGGQEACLVRKGGQLLFEVSDQKVQTIIAPTTTKMTVHRACRLSALSAMAIDR